jgi:hypothetical protein
LRAFAKRTLSYAGAGFVLGLALLTSDLGTLELHARMGLIAVTVCCGCLAYVAGFAMLTSDDDSLVLINLTGRTLLLTDPAMAPFFTLPAAEEPPAALPPVMPRRYYIVTAELALLGMQAGRTDIFTVDARTSTDFGHSGLLVRRLVPATSAGDRPRDGCGA